MSAIKSDDHEVAPWRPTTLGAVTSWMSGGTPFKGNPDFWGGTIPWISAKSIKSFYLNDSEDQVTEAAIAEGARLAMTGDILMLVRGMTLHNDVPIGIAMRPMTFNQDVKGIRGSNGADTRFIAYWLLGHKTRLLAAVDQASHGTGRLQTDLLHAMPIRLPPENEQRAIAGVLGALDDKIEQNRRTARALERLARAIFRAWFVDFEPVKAKAAGATAFPSMSQPVFDALPTRFVDSTIGPVPEGWEVKAIGDIAEQARLSAKPDEIDPATPYIGLEHMPRRSFALNEWEAVSKVTSNKSRFRKGQILFGKLRPYFHKVGVAPVDGVCSTDIVVVEPKSPWLLGPVLGLVTSDAFVDHTTACSSGTKMPRTNWRDMARYKVAIGPSQIASAHTDLVKPIIDHVIAGTYESHKLSELRDYLLPKLLSGTVRVGDATQVTEEAAS